MKHINECLKNKQSLVDFVNESRVDEGWKDFISTVKKKFKQVFEYLKGVVVKAGSYFIPVDGDGKLQPCISPLTAGQAYKDGIINKNSTVVVMDKEGQKITGCKCRPDDGLKLYGSGNSIKYWEKMIKESVDLHGEEVINEVKMHTEDPQAKYNIICDDDELKQEIKMVLKNRKLARLMIWGAPGIGKTAILMNVLDEMKKDFPDFKMIIKTLSNETADNFVLPKYVVDGEGQDKAIDVPKTWLPVYKPTGDSLTDQDLDEKCGRGLLFIDELSRTQQQVLAVILPLINEGLFNGYKLGSGWTIVCASNRAEDEMAGQSHIGNALSNRFSQVYYEPTVKTWRKWADKQNFISPLLLQWLSMPESENMSGGKFFYMDPNEDMDSISPTTLLCTPRSWTNAMRDLAVYSETGTLEGFTIFDIPTRILQRVLNKYVPADAVDSFVAFLEVISKIGDFDRAVHEVWTNDGKGLKIAKKDMNLITLPLAQLICSAHSNSLPSTEEFESMGKWLVAQNSDQLASYVLDVFKNVYMADVQPDLRDSLFFIVKKRSNPKSQANWPLYKNAYAAFENKWGVSIDDDSMPDYSVGLKNIAVKYQAAFKSAIVDGQEALG